MSGPKAQGDAERLAQVAHQRRTPRRVKHCIHDPRSSLPDKMIPRAKLLLLLAASVAGMSLGSCSCAPSSLVSATVVSTVIDVLFEFATASFSLKKLSRLPAVLTVSGGKAALKLETEIGKSGIKVGGSYPIVDLRAAVAEAYRQTHGREPPPSFEVSFAGSALIVKRGAEQFLFFVDSTSFCIANIDEASLVSVDHEKNIVAIEVDADVSDVRFSTTTQGCSEISTQIQTRKQQNAILEIKNAMALLDIRDGVLSLDPITGNVEIEYQQAAGRVKSTFNPKALKAKFGINTPADVNILRINAQSKIDFCSEVAVRASGNDTNSLHQARAECLTKEGYSDNDQTYFKATGLLST